MRNIFKPVLEELKVLWTGAGIPIQEDHTILYNHVSLHDRLRKLEKRYGPEKTLSKNLKQELRKCHVNLILYLLYHLMIVTKNFQVTSIQTGLTYGHFCVIKENDEVIIFTKSFVRCCD